MFKKTWAIAAAAGLALTLAACGGNSTSAGGSSTTAAAGATSAAGSSAAAASSGSQAPASGELPPIDPSVLEGAVIGFALVGS